MGIDIGIIIPIIFWGGFIILGIILYQFYKKKYPTETFFEFTGWRKIIYYLGWLNIFNLVFWIVMIAYYRRYKPLTRKERHKRLAYVIYYFGYITIIVSFYLILKYYVF